jgi:hypothetical protein
MKQVFIICTIFLFSLVANGQTPIASPSSETVKPSLIVGEVISLDNVNKQIVMKTKDGELTAILNDKTQYLKVQPGAKNLNDATPIALSDVGLGDGIVASGILSADAKTIPARKIILMTKADIAKKQERERDDWKKRGVAGRITQLNISKYEITITIRSMTGETPLTIVETSKATYKRYPPDSVKFSDAKESSFMDLKVGDLVRALGTKSADGKTFMPEQIVSGAFKTVAGTVTAIDVEKGEVKIKDLENEKKFITVVIGKDTLIRRLPQQMMGFGGMGGGPGQGGQRPQQSNQGAPPQQGGQGGQRPPQQGSQGGQQGGGPRTFGGGNFDIDEMIERIPPIKITDLKVGDLIGASSSAGADLTRVTAIKLLAGIEPLVRIAQAQAAQRQAAGGGSPSLNLPGLDSIGIP